MSSGPFILGLVTGQVGLLLLLALLFRTFVLCGPSEHVRIMNQRKTRRLENKRIADPEESLKVLHKLGLDHEKLRVEECTWLNFILAKLFFCRLHEDPAFLQDVTDRVEKIVASASEYVSGFAINRLELNRESLPRLTELQVKRLEDGDEDWELCVEGRLFWDDALRLDVEAAATVSWPEGHPTLILPCKLSVSIERIDARFRLAFPKVEATLARSKDVMSELTFSLLPDEFVIDLDIGSSIGHQAKLNNVQKVAQLLASLLQDVLEKEVVWPKQATIPIPTLSSMIFPEEEEEKNATKTA